MYVTESVCHTPETNRTLYISCISIKKKKGRERQLTNLEKMFAKYITNKGLIFR